MNYKTSSSARALASLFVVLCLLFAPVAALAKKGEKNYNRGIQFEKMQQWERAAQEFALAVAANPSDGEYQLHYRRAIFNASQSFMQQGRSLAEQGDYTGAYNAFRQAYGYDPINELAASEMQRVLRLQREKEGARNGNGAGGATGASGSGTPQAGGALSVPNVPAAYRAEAQGARVAATQLPSAVAPSGQSQPLRVINFSGDLEDYVRQLANELNLNVIFDRDFPKRMIKINLRDVTTARALDFIFTAQNIFFQKLDRRTILVADQSKRPQYQQLVLRTFYLQNMAPNDARSLIQSALPPNAGRQPQVVPNPQTNSITVRDTPENIALIALLLNGVDKDRAEVVMDVNIYEVSRSNLLQIGNQVGDLNSLTSLGGLSPQALLLGGTTRVLTGGTTTENKGGTTTTTPSALPLAIAGSFVLPATSLSLFQSKDNTRLLASTQVHAFDGEQSTTRIGQKVPVQTASVSPFGATNNGTNNGAVNNGLFGSGYPVIQYQDTGLILKFTPTVFPNQEVQVKMEIESNDVIGGAANLTPTFSQRSISGTARIPNNRTMMIASVAQDKHSDGRRGLPLLGLIPILGRLFSTPTNSDAKSDVVVTVTPRVLRAPTITPEDIETRDSGTLQTPMGQSLEALLVQAEREDQLAAARQLPTNPNVQLPAAPQANPTTTAAVERPRFVPAPAALANVGGVPATDSSPSASLTTVANPNDATAQAAAQSSAAQPSAAQSSTPPAAGQMPALAPALLSSGSPGLVPAALTDPPPAAAPAVAPQTPAAGSTAPNRVAPPVAAAAAPLASGSGAALLLVSNQPEMKVGERQRLLVLVKTGTPLNLAAATLRFDPHVLAVRAVTKGNLFDAPPQAGALLTQSVDPSGALLAVIAPAAGTSINGMGVLLLIEVEALAPGQCDVSFDPTGVHFMAADGHGVVPQLAAAHFVVR